jgi:putative glutamine amidotransferase
MTKAPSAEHLGKVNIGLSYDAGSPKYRLYAGALLAAAAEAHLDIQPVWLAGNDRPLNERALGEIDGLILTGGPDVAPSRYGYKDVDDLCEIAPARDDAEWEILRVTVSRRRPILAICRGMQLFNVFRGGSLVPDIRTREAHRLQDHERHAVATEDGSALGALVGQREGEVTSTHHQAIDRLGNGLRVAARHPDGTIEAIEWSHPMRKAWLAAVQWHPERMGLDEPFAGALYRGFLQAVALSRG